MTDQERIEQLEQQIQTLTAKLAEGDREPATKPATPETPSGVSKELGAALRDDNVRLDADKRALAATLAKLARRQGYKDIAAEAQALADGQ